MKDKSKSGLRAPLLLAAATTLGYVGMKALLGIRKGAEEDFFQWTGPASEGLRIGSVQFNLPLMYYRDDSFLAVFSADYQPVRALLPSPRLYPVKLPGGRAAVMVAAFHYLETSVGPYGEVGIAVPCIYGRPGLPLLPLAFEERQPGWGFFVVHLPVTSKVAMEIGRGVWGYPKFLADMEFEKRPAYQSVRLSEGNAHILTLTVQQRGGMVKDNRPLISYSVLNGELIKTTIPVRSIYQLGFGGAAARLELGEHRIAEQLGSLSLSTAPVAARNYLTRYAILPAGCVVAPADSAPALYTGEDREFARLTVRYDDRREPIDCHAALRNA